VTSEANGVDLIIPKRVN